MEDVSQYELLSDIQVNHQQGLRKRQTSHGKLYHPFKLENLDLILIGTYFDEENLAELVVVECW